eukprot:Gregarina_sp_Poly_1__11445@NODE_97_length_14617_cov_146_063230_g84_i0_p6_GENE_NODE_97_length_14617_cov_146_063230_g84_i0NODE_97_length_14617_cov_146_063230_g84_i0_p6_ORF_typecomplete_len475_score86_35ATG16/PF08614_11/8_7e02ATG16/PF08614_11/0_014ATG16/PF08614_11/0_00011GRIP/PF01465_20/8_7e02GRIP/PF01465_20/0_00045MAD/PF05557_13/15MAD/PF05557_13/0_12MAD/PF05557_13/0_0065HOOK/PF05622_12/0_017HOOK/PF05622_12/0_061TACC_C/PF05010_14/2_4e03TACC_C/PF05010_14/5_2TACC_C/PF05010_14/0_00048CENPF_leu_zip/PF1
MTDLQRELRLANKTIDKLKAIAIDLKVVQKEREILLEFLQAQRPGIVDSHESVVQMVKKLLSEAPRPTSDHCHSTPAVSRSITLSQSRFETVVELEAANPAVHDTPDRSSHEVVRPVAGALLSPAGESQISMRTVEKLKAEISRFREEALGARENLRVFAEVKEQEIEELRGKLEDGQRRFAMVQKNLNEHEDSIAFLESELNIKKMALERCEYLNKELLTQNEALMEFREAFEKRALSEKRCLRRVDTSPLFIATPLPSAQSSVHAASPQALSEEFVNHCQPDSQHATPIVVDIALNSPSDNQNAVLKDFDSLSPTNITNPEDASNQLQVDIQRAESEKQQTIAMLRAKDLVIEKLHRRLKNMASNETLDVAISRVAARESKLERELTKLKARYETLEAEHESLKSKINGAEVNNRDWLYLRELLPKFLQHFQNGEVDMARALLPVVCSILRLSNDECVSILKSLSIPAPRRG